MPVVQVIPIVLKQKHAEIRPASIHARMETHAPATQNVKHKIIVLFAIVQPHSSAIRSRIALLRTLLSNQNAHLILNVPLRPLALTNVAAIHALNVIHVLETPNAVSLNIAHCAIVHWDGEVIHKCSVINVSYFLFISSMISYILFSYISWENQKFLYSQKFIK